MANYKTHTKFNIIMLPVIAIPALYFLTPTSSEIAIFSGFYLYSTLFFNPDLDLANQIRFFSVRGVLTLPFRPYSWIFRHRGISHTFLIGTLTRILWIFFLVSIFLFFYNGLLLDTQILYSFYLKYEMFILYAFAGIFIADIFHLLLDRKRS